jgi:hypothetical protein
MWNFDQAKIALTLVKEWPLKKWGHRFMQQKNLEKLAYQECYISNPLQQILPQKG